MIRLNKEPKPKNARAKILKAARAVFVERGYAGASMSQIAKRADVSRSLLFHHFVSKDELWHAAKEQIVNEARDKEVLIPSTDLSFKEFLQELVERTFRFYKENPDILKMITWQRVGEYEPKEKSEQAKQWMEALEHYQKSGEAISDVPSAYIMSYVLSAICSAVLDAPMLISTKDLKSKYPTFIAQQLIKSLSV